MRSVLFALLLVACGGRTTSGAADDGAAGSRGGACWPEKRAEGKSVHWHCEADR